MKAEIPEKIYFGTQAVNPFYGLTRKCANDDVEYVRADAFIDKACEWLKEIFMEYEDLTDYNPMEDFKSYMKGE